MRCSADIAFRPIEVDADPGTQPAHIVFEVRDSTFAQDPNHWRNVCEWYRRNGFRLALSYGAEDPVSVRTLLDIRPDYIKLEKSLLRNIETLSCSVAIRKLADLGERLRIPVVADGVESGVTVENLWLLCVYKMQGPLWSGL